MHRIYHVPQLLWGTNHSTNHPCLSSAEQNFSHLLHHKTLARQRFRLLMMCWVMIVFDDDDDDDDGVICYLLYVVHALSKLSNTQDL